MQNRGSGIPVTQPDVTLDSALGLGLRSGQGPLQRYPGVADDHVKPYHNVLHIRWHNRVMHILGCRMYLAAQHQIDFLLLSLWAYCCWTASFPLSLSGLSAVPQAACVAGHPGLIVWYIRCRAVCTRQQYEHFVQSKGVVLTIATPTCSRRLVRPQRSPQAIALQEGIPPSEHFHETMNANISIKKSVKGL